MTNLSIYERPVHEQRVINESIDLKTKLEKLVNFLDTPVFKQMKAEDQTLLNRQAAVMLSYLNILEARILRF